MSLYERIQRELFEARRKHEDVKLSTLSLLKAEVVRASKESGASGVIDDALVMHVARKEMKKREEAAVAFRSGNREDAAKREEPEAKVLQTYLPAPMSDADIEKEIKAVIAEVKPQGPGGFGAVMKVAIPRLAGRADGAAIAKVVQAQLASPGAEKAAENPEEEKPKPKPKAKGKAKAAG